MAAQGNEDVAKFYCTKHSWRGKYKRVFSIGTNAITTYNPNTHEVTNQWCYNEFVGISPSPKASNEFIITMRKGRKTQQMTFSTEFRSEVLTHALMFSPLFCEQPRHETDKKFDAAKFHWDETKVKVFLVVRRYCLSQVDPTGHTLTDYKYKDIEYMAKVADHPGAFVVAAGGFGRLHMFLTEQRDDVMKAIILASRSNIGYEIAVHRDSITQHAFLEKRLGKYSDDDSITSLTEFKVQKHTPRYLEPAPRILALSENCIIERDPSTYIVVTIRPLSEVFALIRYTDDPQRFSIEYVNDVVRKYSATERDALLCSILDGVRASGNRYVCVKMTRTNRGQRLGPLHLPVEEEVESQYLRYLVNIPPSVQFHEAVEKFNSNVAYSGLNHAVSSEGIFAENKEKLINGALTALLMKEGDQTSLPNDRLEEQFHALRRLVASKAGYGAFTSLTNFREIVGKKVVRALRRKDDGISHASVDFLCALMQPMHDNYDLRQEQMNKSSLLSSKPFLEMVLEPLKVHVQLGTGALVVSAILDFFTFAVCPPYSETTEAEKFDMVLELISGLGRTVFKLFQHPSLAIVKAAGLIMKAIIEEGTAEMAKKMQDLALAEGALPRHLHTSLFTASSDNRLLTHRQLSRHLVGLWVTGNPTANALLHRILPLGLIQYLKSREKVPEEADRMHVRDNLKAVQTLSKRRINKLELTLIHWRTRLRSKPQKDTSAQRPVTLRKRRQQIKTEDNWALFYYQFSMDHSLSTLIWNYKTREELREALENDIRSFTVDKDLFGYAELSWNHVEFEVRYECLAEEIKIGDYYLRLLLEEGADGDTKFENPREFFNDLYHRFLLSPKPSMKAMCLQAMAIVYGRCHEEIGPFNDTAFVVRKLEECEDRTERDRLLQFIDKLLHHRQNVKLFLDTNGVRVLVDLVTLAHLHTQRAYVPLQTSSLEASPDQQRDTEKEWYYGNKDKEREGPYSFGEMKEMWKEGGIHQKTRCWAQGMEGWRTLEQIPQLKWQLLAQGTSLMNESDMATLILNIFICMCQFYPSRDAENAIVRPLPRAKRLLSEPNTLPHIVQLLLTFDPSLVERVTKLLNIILEDNPQLPRVFSTGVFFFILMYTGSNILPIAEFLKYTHMKQSFRPDEQQSSDIMQRSILGQLLPEAMVCFLENHGSVKFSETFLGEFDNPEAIWNSEMRRMMIEKIAAHIADFTPRLQSNTRATYQYCAMPVVQYRQLEDELFCNIYYLRHLCDTLHFPDWPIKEPVPLLKDVLEEWKKEVDKKPPEMSVDQAYDALGLQTGVGGHEEIVVRKAYFKLAQKYHPDKNPDGRERFEAVNKAYEFLCSKNARRTEGPDPVRIVLLLQTQSILFQRYADVLRPYKYAGYPMLIKTIQLETGDNDLFSKSAPILTAASEVTFHTMNTSALNAEELRRENGMVALQAAFSRCVDVLSASSNPDDMAVQVCTHICRCFRVSAQFESCRTAITEVPVILKDICRILYYKHLSRLNCVAVQTCSAFSVDQWLQSQLLHAGVLWHILQFVFNYDYTLDEGGVESSDQTNQQEVANNLARLSITCTARLAGIKVGGTEEETPDNPSVTKVIRSLFTPYIIKTMTRVTTNELLKTLNCNMENPYLIWDNRTRAELTKYLEEQQQSIIRTGECDTSFGEDFRYSVLSEELVVGEIYVRVYNEQPTFVLEDAKGFASDLLNFIETNAQYLHSLIQMSSDIDSSSQSQRLQHVEMTLQSLYHVIHGNAGVEMQCLGHFKLIFSLLSLQGAAKLQRLALQAISTVTGNKKCVENIAEANVLQFVLLVLHMLPSSQELVLEVLQALMSDTKIVKESILKGALIYLLNLFCNSQNPTVREETASLFAKMITDKLVGPKVRIVLMKFLPVIFMDAMRDSPEASVHMFENSQENPELIWNDEAREKVSQEVAQMTEEFFQKQKQDPDILWKLPEDFQVVYTQVQGEVSVGGVFLRLFIAQPMWVLRKPKEFLIALLEKFGQLTQSSNPDGEILETVTTACVCLFAHQTTLADQVPPLGHIPRILGRMKATNDIIPRSCALVIHVLADSDVCVRTMAKCDAITPLMAAMRRRGDIIHTCAETIKKLFELCPAELVVQAINADLIPYLLELLERDLIKCDKPSATKAIIAESLKLMAKDLANGEKILEMLNSSPVWSAYKDQKHDLFISSTPVAGYLTGPTAGIAGYLTAGSTSAPAPSAPPPLTSEPPENTAAD